MLRSVGNGRLLRERKRKRKREKESSEVNGYLLGRTEHGRDSGHDLYGDTGGKYNCSAKKKQTLSPEMPKCCCCCCCCCGGGSNIGSISISDCNYNGKNNSKTVQLKVGPYISGVSVFLFNSFLTHQHSETSHTQDHHLLLPLSPFLSPSLFHILSHLLTVMSVAVAVICQYVSQSVSQFILPPSARLGYCDFHWQHQLPSTVPAAPAIRATEHCH